MLMATDRWETGYGSLIRPREQMDRGSHTRPRENQPLLQREPKPCTWVAMCLTDIIAAWQLVYNVYRETGLIDPNPRRIHRPPEALQPGTSVFCTGRGTALESTMTAIPDGPLGLPLDTVYSHEIDALRRRGLKLMELGLFAHRQQVNEGVSDSLRRPHKRPPSSDGIKRIMELMRYIYYFGKSVNLDGYVIGVHPHHMRFYTRLWGFEQCGEERTYSKVKDKPVVLLRSMYEEVLSRSALPIGVKHAVDNPVSASEFRGRYMLGLEHRLLGGGMEEEPVLDLEEELEDLVTAAA